jgi:hypothetical protein
VTRADSDTNLENGNIMTAVLVTPAPVETTPGRPSKPVSKSKARKRDRAPYQPENLIRPNLTDGYELFGYVYQRAEMGEFTGAPGGTVCVLQYLANFAWRSEDNSDHAPIGTVMRGKSPLAKIAASTGLSYNGARNCVNWLCDNGWIKAWLESDNEQRFVLLLSVNGERARAGLHAESSSQAPVIPDGTADVAPCSTVRDLSYDIAQPVTPDGTASATGWHTVQGVCRGTYSDDVAEDQSQTQSQNRAADAAGPAAQDSGLGEVPSALDLDSILGRSPSAREPEPEPEEPQENVDAFLAFMRERGIGPGAGVLPIDVWRALGLGDPYGHNNRFLPRLVSEGVLATGKLGYYLVRPVAVTSDAELAYAGQN